MKQKKLINETIITRPGVMVVLHELSKMENDPYDCFAIEQFFNEGGRIGHAIMCFRKETLIAFRDILNKVFQLKK